jgi:hypothetical protein
MATEEEKVPATGEDGQQSLTSCKQCRRDGSAASQAAHLGYRASEGLGCSYHCGQVMAQGLLLDLS